MSFLKRLLTLFLPLLPPNPQSPSPPEVSMGRSDGRRGIDTEGRREDEGREEAAAGDIFSFLPASDSRGATARARRDRRATLHVQLTGWLRDSRGILQNLAGLVW